MKKRARKGTVSYVILKATEAKVIARQAYRGAEDQDLKELGHRIRALRCVGEPLPGLLRDAIIFEAQKREGSTGLERSVMIAIAEVEIALRSLIDTRLLKYLLGEKVFQEGLRERREPPGE